MTIDSVVPFLLHVTVFGLMFYVGYGIARDLQLRMAYTVGFAFKVVCGFAVGGLYLFYYGVGDATSYYDTAAEMSALSWEQFYAWSVRVPEYNESQRAIFFTKVVAWMIRFLYTDFWLVSVYFSLFSFFGCFYLLLQINKHLGEIKGPICLAFMVIPSVVFWSSGLLKESLAFGSMCLIIGWFIRIVYAQRTALMDWCFMIFGAFLLLKLKYYVAVVLFPSLLVLFLLQQLRRRNIEIKWFYWPVGIILLALLLWIGLPWLHPNFEPSRLARAIVQSREMVLQNSDVENTVKFLQLENSALTTSLNVIVAAISGIIRPFVFESLRFPGILSGIENFMFLTLLIINFKNLRILKDYRLEVGVILFYVFVLSSFFTYSLPNFGTLARFKVYYMPFLWTIILLGHPIFKVRWLALLTSFNR